FTARANLEACREGTCSATDPAGSWRSAATIRRKSRRAGVAVPQRLTDRGRCAMATPQGSTRRRRNSAARKKGAAAQESRSEEHTSELQSRENLVCRLLLEEKKGWARMPWTGPTCACRRTP